MACAPPGLCAHLIETVYVSVCGLFDRILESCDLLVMSFVKFDSELSGVCDVHEVPSVL